MKPNYIDILQVAAESGRLPLWYNEQGVPRFAPFHPRLCASLMHQEAVLAEIRCQPCGTPFLVALTWSSQDYSREHFDLPPLPRLTAGRLAARNAFSYGDPPNVGCCPSGHVMSSEFHRIVEAWVITENYQWRQLSAEEVAAIPAPSEVMDSPV